MSSSNGGLSSEFNLNVNCEISGFFPTVYSELQNQLGLVQIMCVNIDLQYIHTTQLLGSMT